MDATRFLISQSAPQIPTWDIVLSPPQSPGLPLPPNDHGFAGSLLSECFSGTGLPSDAFDSYFLPDEMNGLDFEDRRFLFTTDTGQGSGSLSGSDVSMQVRKLVNGVRRLLNADFL